MSVNSYLSNLGSSLVLSEQENSKIRTSLISLESRAEGYFSSFSRCIRFGSYTRGTILPRRVDPESDIDLMLLFDDSDSCQPQAYLNRIRGFVDKYYPYSEERQSQPSIVLDLQHIRFELTPAQPTWVEGQYEIPFDRSTWQHTTPKSFDEELVTCNADNGYKIKPLIRLLKLWNIKKTNRGFASYQLERDVMRALRYAYLSCKTYPEYLLKAFDALYSPTYSSRVASAKEGIRKALEYESQGIPASALIEIKKVFPED